MEDQKSFLVKKNYEAGADCDSCGKSFPKDNIVVLTAFDISFDKTFVYSLCNNCFRKYLDSV
jgi:hypothetical protein